MRLVKWTLQNFGHSLMDMNRYKTSQYRYPYVDIFLYQFTIYIISTFLLVFLSFYLFWMNIKSIPQKHPFYNCSRDHFSGLQINYLIYFKMERKENKQNGLTSISFRVKNIFSLCQNSSLQDTWLDLCEKKLTNKEKRHTRYVLLLENMTFRVIEQKLSWQNEDGIWIESKMFLWIELVF